ncbi:MAG: helix-turn-helix domain-containing protein [Proteobacteria bacterium]|nr:helix-turn-helix domain-containing protein [Pseudomonadota bacterium]
MLGSEREEKRLGDGSQKEEGGSKEAIRQSLSGLGKRVRVLRESVGITQDEMAARCGITFGFVSLLERGERSPSYETLWRISQALGVSISELFFEDGLEKGEAYALERLLRFAKRGELTAEQVERFIAVGHAMFGFYPGIHCKPTHGLCGVEGCGQKILARGLCSAHYHKSRNSFKRMSLKGL